MQSANRSSSSETSGSIRRNLPALLLTGLFFLTSLGCQQFTSQKTPLSTPTGAELFRAKCGKCHTTELALSKHRSEGLWYVTINRMKDEHQADITPAEVAQLVKYHVERQQQEAMVFKEKCQKCHPGKSFLEQKLSSTQARAIVKRMQEKSGNTITDQEVEIIIRYHTQAQQTAVEDNLRGIYRQILVEQPNLNKGLGLFLEKCSSCHQPGRALTVIKDPEAWTQTIKRMQNYSNGAITDPEVNELVAFHVTVQQKEISTFAETCTKCHTDERINSRSMSEEQWLETIKRMQRKAPQLITDEKVNLLSAYFHRRELAMARIFADKCQLCHPRNNDAATTFADSGSALNGLITLANTEFGGVVEVKDVNSLLATHQERQRRGMQVYLKNCTTCHPDGPPSKAALDTEAPRKKPRSEWIAFIASLQDVELNKENQVTINSQIEFHISRF